MSDWYYATADGQRHGPLPAAGLAALARSGKVGPQTLVWREGLAQWTPLSAHEAELGLVASPPPVPGQARAPMAQQATPPARRNGCLVALLIGIGGLVLVSIIGILAAIALPAYNDYTMRAKVAGALAEARVHQPEVVAFIETHSRCPTNDDEGFATAESYAGGQLASIRFGEFEESSLCGLAATIHAPGVDAIDDQPIWLEYNAAVDTWLCSSAVEDRYLPHECRG